MPDYYQILGVSVSSSPREIALAYRAKCKLLHPDVNPSEDATLQMQMVNEAYRVLKNDSLRYVYDGQFGICNAAPRSTPRTTAYSGASCAYHSRFYETSSWSDDFKKREKKISIEDYWWYFYLVEIPYGIIRSIVASIMGDNFVRRK